MEEQSFLDALGSSGEAGLRERGTVRRVQRGAALFHEQTLPSSVAVLLSGRVKLTRVTSEGRDVLLAIRGPGELLGEQSALDGEPRSATAVALEAVEALTVGAEDFVAFVSRTPAASLFLMRLLSRRLRDADDKRVGFASQDILGRVASRRGSSSSVSATAAASNPGRGSTCQSPRRTSPRGPGRRARASAARWRRCGRWVGWRPRGARSRCSISTRCAAARTNPSAPTGAR